MSLHLTVNIEIRKAIMRIVALCLLSWIAIPAIGCTTLDCAPMSTMSTIAKPQQKVATAAAISFPAPTIRASTAPQPRRDTKKTSLNHHSPIIIFPTIGLLSLICISLAGFVTLPPPALNACKLLLDFFTSASLYLLIIHRFHGTPGKVYLLLNCRTLLLAGLLLLHAYLEHHKSAGLLAVAPIRCLRERLKLTGILLLARAKRKIRLAA